MNDAPQEHDQEPAPSEDELELVHQMAHGQVVGERWEDGHLVLVTEAVPRAECPQCQDPVR